MSEWKALGLWLIVSALCLLLFFSVIQFIQGWQAVDEQREIRRNTPYVPHVFNDYDEFVTPKGAWCIRTDEHLVCTFDSTPQ